MADLVYSANPGCASSVSFDGGTPGQCGGAEAAAVPHRYQFPKPAHDTRLYVCARHARDEPTAEPLTDQDRRMIAARYERRAAQLEPARRAGRLPASLQGIRPGI